MDTSILNSLIMTSSLAVSTSQTKTFSEPPEASFLPSGDKERIQILKENKSEN